ncbi:MAG: helix-turn-helix domain-containing protein, partial [Alcanivorax sp.]
ATHWNRTAAAKKLGMTFRSLRYRLKKLELDRDDGEAEDNE